MSNWYEVSIVAEAIQQQLEAALSEYGPVPGDQQAQAYVSQAKFALGKLSDYASTKYVQKTPTAPISGKVKTNQVPELIAAMCAVADVPVTVFNDHSRARNLVAARSALAWMLHEGVAFEIPPSFPEMCVWFGMLSTRHTTLVSAKRRAELAAHLVTAMYDECDRLGIRTNPRPDWAKEAA
jgi:hypothetical protein